MTKRRRGEREVGERVQAADHGDATCGSDDSIGSGTGEHALAASGWPSARLICVFLLLAAATVASFNWGLYLRQVLRDPNPAIGVPNYDFFQYYVAGHNWRLGIDPYLDQPTAPGAIQHPMGSRGVVDGYIYPPTWVPAYGALSRLSYDSARAVWLILGVVAFVAAAVVAVTGARGRRLEVATAVAVLTVASYPFQYALIQGQIDLLVAGLSIAAFLLYPRGRGWPTAALLALTISAKLTPLLMLAGLIVFYRDWRLLLKALVCSVWLFLMSLVWVDVGLYREFGTEVMVRISDPDPLWNNQSLIRYFSEAPGLARAITALGFGGVLLVAYRWGVASDQLATEARLLPRRGEHAALLLLAISAMLVFSPLTWVMAYVWVIVPAALLLVGTRWRGRALPPVTVAVGVALSQMIPQDDPVLSVLNLAGAVVMLAGLILFYTPLSTLWTSRSTVDATGRRG